MVDDPGQGMLPRTPQNRTRIEVFNIQVPENSQLKFYLECVAMSSTQVRSAIALKSSRLRRIFRSQHIMNVGKESPKNLAGFRRIAYTR